MTNSILNSSNTPDRFQRLPWLFRDEGLLRLEILLDESFRIPIIGYRFGIDGIIGIIPGLGVIITSLLTLIIPIAAWLRGARWSLVLRMIANMAIALVIGAIPFLGDAFDIYFKPNRRNYLLLKRHLDDPRRHHWADLLFLLALFLFVALLFLIPVLVTAWVLIWFAQEMNWIY
jgi:hypothetical protein